MISIAVSIYLEHLNKENFVIFPLHLSIANYHRVLSFVFNFHGYEKSENLYWNGELDYQTWDCKKWERPAQLKGRPAIFFLVETLFFKYKKLSWSEVSSEKHWKLCLNILYIIERRKKQLIWKKL